MEEKRDRQVDPILCKTDPCWEVRNCPSEWRAECPAWQYEAGLACWEVNGTRCQGKRHLSRGDRMRACQSCEVYQP